MYKAVLKFPDPKVSLHKTKQYIIEMRRNKTRFRYALYPAVN
uniref:Uncharacterized protein n=1 Tax=Schistosoma japonicum TaxID=6182 RepID=Q5BYB8_SCHJA|nr:unknown [Schistosoma japonicum]